MGKKLSVKELRKKCNYRKRETWETRGCYSCSSADVDAIILDSGASRCGYHGFGFDLKCRCDNYNGVHLVNRR